MLYESINRNHWGAFFNLISKSEIGRWMQLEVVGREFGDQIEQDWILFDGLSYDEDSDTVYVHSMDLEHEITQPRRVIVQEDGPRKTVVIEDRDGLQILHFRDPVLLNGR